MRQNYTQLYAHCVWATWERMPLIVPDLQMPIYRAITAECRKLGCDALAIGGISDHIHLLISFPPSLAISSLMKQIKGSSSHLVTHQLNPGEFFKWQGGYSAFTLSSKDLDAIKAYIKNQASHHRKKQVVPDWELL
ncbi:MAG: IS200/IS605 family transposase [Jaaginema sp. PMC 1079.18]|nr:IS200/IS605 family transposase [Jaaginema sp. PMC 1080.18]MEC4850628.1 IS200/IS605 family transposase [Jaaginema sp. PMC 1079.18]MEC4867812.1 IS200/IS605 family transposase [Jaaginema sp. PMC 1078.18]